MIYFVLSNLFQKQGVTTELRVPEGLKSSERLVGRNMSSYRVSKRLRGAELWPNIKNTTENWRLWQCELARKLSLEPRSRYYVSKTHNRRWTMLYYKNTICKKNNTWYSLNFKASERHACEKNLSVMHCLKSKSKYPSRCHLTSTCTASTPPITINTFFISDCMLYL